MWGRASPFLTVFLPIIYLEELEISKRFCFCISHLANSCRQTGILKSGTYWTWWHFKISCHCLISIKYQIWSFVVWELELLSSHWVYCNILIFILNQGWKCQVDILYNWIELTLPCCFVPLTEPYSSKSQYYMISTALIHYERLGTVCLRHLSLCNYSTSSLAEEGAEREEMLLFWQLFYLKHISVDWIGPSFITLWTHGNCMILNELCTMEAYLLQILCHCTGVLVPLMCGILISSFRSLLEVHNANLFD